VTVRLVCRQPWQHALVLTCESSRADSLTVAARKSLLSRARKQAVLYANFCKLVLVLFLSVLACVSCAHPNRVSRGALQRLAKNHEPYVLVFGSVLTPPGTIAHPEIRFLYPASRSAPESMLWSLIISSGDRFYAVLQTPQALPQLDEFIAEVGSADTGFDKIDYVRLQKRDQPLAMYVGEIAMSPAENRTARGQTIVVNIRDDFQNAEQELKRLYPSFAGTIAKAALLRNPVPMAKPPERTR
jgi:hypothetical protein